MRLTAEKLAAARGGGIIIDNISFALDRGEALLVTGPNGSGKSTLLRVVAGLLPAAAGRVELTDDGDDPADIGENSHYLGHLNPMKPALTVFENLSFWRAFNSDAKLGIADALAAVGLETVDRLPFAYLSAGQRRRIAIAALLLNQRPLWLLDEPSAGLDAASEEKLAQLMRSHLRAGGIIIAATHSELGLDTARTLKLGSGS